MKENENKKPVVHVREGLSGETTEMAEPGNQSKAEKLKKPIIFGLMAIVFIGCMYLIFKPSTENEETEKTGLNVSVPQATGDGLPTDKGKAYEQEMQERKQDEKRDALVTLSDYWHTDEVEQAEVNKEEEDNPGSITGNGYGTSGNPALNSYRNTQSTLSSFYEQENTETAELRRQLSELKQELADKDVPKAATVDDQLELMERSYQMAAKYLPTANTAAAVPNGGNTAEVSATSASQKEYFVPFTPKGKSAVSALYRAPSDSAFAADWSGTKNRAFHTAGVNQAAQHPKNSIRACVHQSKSVTGESTVRLRLLEPARTPSRTLPKGTLLSANARIQAGRLQLTISSIELEGTIIPVDITIYDLDGQQGLYMPHTPEVNALTEMAGNMSQQSGTSIMMTQSAGQQVAADLSRGVVQGISGYFSKKVRTPKVTLKAGHQVLLVSKK